MLFFVKCIKIERPNQSQVECESNIYLVIELSSLHLSYANYRVVLTFRFVSHFPLRTVFELNFWSKLLLSHLEQFDFFQGHQWYAQLCLFFSNVCFFVIYISAFCHNVFFLFIHLPSTLLHTLIFSQLFWMSIQLPSINKTHGNQNYKWACVTFVYKWICYFVFIHVSRHAWLTVQRCKGFG